MKALFPLVPILGLTLLSCQSKPQGETIPLSTAPVQATGQATEQNLKNSGKTAEIQKTQDTDTENPVYHKPVKIKVKRDGKDNYSWEIMGDSAKEIVAMDRELRKKLLTDDTGKEK